MATTSKDTLIGYALDKRYIIERQVGVEWLGKVYVANDRLKKHKVCVKVLEPHLANEQEGLGRFRRELFATAQIKHPHCVAMLASGDNPLFHYLVLEHIEGPSLGDVIAAAGGMTVERVVRIAAQIAGALSAAHSDGVVHRNLTPKNILLLEDEAGNDFVKVSDFGLSHAQDGVEAAQMDAIETAIDRRLGSEPYMAPEYIEHAQVDARGDLYTLGILIYEALVGEPPFTGSPSQVINRQLGETPKRLSTLCDGIPPWLDALVVELLAKSPDDRPASAVEVLRRLEEGAGEPLLAVGPSRPRAKDDLGVASQAPPLSPWLVTLGVVVVVAVVVSVVVAVLVSTGA